MKRGEFNFLTLGRKRLVHATDHVSCDNHSREGSDLLVEILELKAGTVHRRSQECSGIAFICKGSLRLSSKDTIQRVLQKGEMAFLPVGLHLYIEAKEDVFVFFCKFSCEIRFCELLRLEDMDKYAKSVNEEFNTLPILTSVSHFLDSFIPCVMDQLQCKHYISLKINELIFLFRAYYTKEQIAAFFFPYIGIDYQFRNSIYRNALTSKSVTELAGLSNMSVSGFLHRFKRLMDCRPSEFINKEKAKHIHYELMCSDTSLHEIGEKYGFEAASTFANFCKKQLGKTPGQIRAEGYFFLK